MTCFAPGCYFFSQFTLSILRAVPIVLERLVDAATERRTRCQNAVVVAIPWDDPVAAIRQDTLSQGEVRKEVEGFYHRMYALYSSLIRITPVKEFDDDDTSAVAAPAAALMTPIKLPSTPVELQTSSSVEPTTTEKLESEGAGTESAPEPSLSAESEVNTVNDNTASPVEAASVTPAQTHDAEVTLVPDLDNASKSTKDGAAELSSPADPDADSASLLGEAASITPEQTPDMEVGPVTVLDPVSKSTTDAPVCPESGTNAIKDAAPPDQVQQISVEQTDQHDPAEAATVSETASGSTVSTGDEAEIVTPQNASALPEVDTAANAESTLSLAPEVATQVDSPEAVPPIDDAGVSAPAQTSLSTTEASDLTTLELQSEPDPPINTEEASEAVSPAESPASQTSPDAEETLADPEETVKAPANVPVPNNTEVRPNKSEALPTDASKDAPSAITSNEVAAKKASCEVVVDHVLGALLRYCA